MLFVKQQQTNIQNQNQKNVIKLINRLYDEGYYIKILTARYSGRFKDDFKSKIIWL